ncbi:hypothetical protein DL770_010440 [Monosporascus sp. CRB-9-2]|nr:hypothetical protein DL770_010440 [Monosporascus sp. CRB-9-2]
MRGGTLEGATNVSLLAGYMTEAGGVELQSFSMHVGSATSRSRVPGSLYFDGYDSNRVAGGVLAVSRTSFKGAAFVGMPLDDMPTSAAAGGSPFKEGNENDSVPGEATTMGHSGLLVAGNDTVSARLEVAVNACAPYLNLRAALTSWEDTRTPPPGGSGEDGGDDAGSASGGASGTAIGVVRGTARGKGLQVCGMTLLGNRGYRPARTGDDGGSGEGPAEVVDLQGHQAGEPKTCYGGRGGGQEPYETVVPIRYGVAELPPQRVGRAAAEMEAPPAPPAAYSVYEMAGDNAYNSR